MLYNNSIRLQLLRALDSGDLERIFNAFSQVDVNLFYKYANSNEYLNARPLTQSNYLKTVKRALYDVLYGKYKHDYKNLIVEIENNLQLYEKAIVKWDYLGETYLEPQIYNNFEKEDNIISYWICEELDEKEVDVQISYDLDTNIETRSFEIENRELSYNEYLTLGGKLEQSLAWPGKVIFEFYGESRLKDCVDHIAKLDEIESQLTYNTRLDTRTLSLSEDMAKDALPSKEILVDGKKVKVKQKWSFNYFMRKLSQGVMHIKTDSAENINNDVKWLSADINNDNLRKDKLSTQQTIGEIVGLSAVTLGLDNASANASGQALMTRDIRTQRTYDNLINDRLAQLNAMFESPIIEQQIRLNGDYEPTLEYIAYDTQTNIQLATIMLQQGKLPNEVALELAFPNKTLEERQEIARQMQTPGIDYSVGG